MDRSFQVRYSVHEVEGYALDLWTKIDTGKKGEVVDILFFLRRGKCIPVIDLVRDLG